MKTIIDFYGAVLDWPDRLAAPLEFLKRSGALRRWLRRPPLGQLHGYARHPSELRRLYRRAGLRIAREVRLEGYKYAAVLEK